MTNTNPLASTRRVLPPLANVRTHPDDNFEMEILREDMQRRMLALEQKSERMQVQLNELNARIEQLAQASPFKLPHAEHRSETVTPGAPTGAKPLPQIRINCFGAFQVLSGEQKMTLRGRGKANKSSNTLPSKPLPSRASFWLKPFGKAKILTLPITDSKFPSIIYAGCLPG